MSRSLKVGLGWAAQVVTDRKEMLPYKIITYINDWLKQLGGSIACGIPTFDFEIPLKGLFRSLSLAFDLLRSIL